MTDATLQATDMEIDPEVACPIAPVVDIVFSRWTTPILWSLNEYGRQRFVELERRITKITPKVLTQRLRQLERDGLVIRTYHPEVPPRVEYEISELGRSLAPSSPPSPTEPPSTWTRSRTPARTTTPAEPYGHRRNSRRIPRRTRAYEPHPRRLGRPQRLARTRHDQPRLVRRHDRLRTVAQAELGQDATDVRLHGLLADVQS